MNRPECGKVTTLQVLLGQANQSFSVSGCAAPLQSATVDGTALALTYSESLDEDSVPAGGDFTVAVTADSVTSTAANRTVSSVSIKGAVVTLTLATAVRYADTVTVSYTAGTNPLQDSDGRAAADLDRRAVTNQTTEDNSYWLRDLALGQVTSVTGTVASGEGYMAVDGSADTAVALSGSWTLAVDLVDVYELATVQVAPLAGVQLGGFVVEGRAPGSGSGTWEELGRITAAGGGSVTVSSSQVRDMVRISPVTAPSAGTSDSVAVLEVFGYELRQGRSLTMDFSGSLADAGLTQRGSSFSIDSGRLVSGAGSSSFVVADLCDGCNLDHEAIRQATVTMLVEFPAVNPAGSNIGVSLGVGFEEGRGRQRGVLAELAPWRPVSGNEGPLTMSLYCGGGGSGGAGRLRGWGVNLDCSGSGKKELVTNTGQDLTDAFDPDVTLPGGRVWVELEYRNLKLWVRVWPEGEERPVLPRSGLRFGAEHFGGSSFNRDGDWLLNPGRLSLRAWGFSNSGQVKIESIVVSDVLLGPKLGTERGAAGNAGTANELTHIGRYYPMGKAVVDKPVYVTDRDAGKLPRVVVDGDPGYVSLYEKAWELAYERTRQPTASEPWYRTWLDEAHSSQVFLWDLAAMMWFGKYMNEAFDPMGSMEIFYQTQRDDGAIARRFFESDGRTDSNDGTVNPPLFAWSEWQWYQITGDTERIRQVLPALREYLDYSSIVRWAQDSAHRLYWNDGGGSGLDALKRPYARNNDGSKQWGDPDMSAQTAQAYLLLGDMYEVVGDSDEAARMRAIGDAIGERINRFLWNDFTDGGVDYGQWFYADSAGNIAPTAGQYVDEPQGPGLWYSLIGATPAQTTRLRNIMSSEDWYFTDMPFGTLPKSHSQFQGWGGHSQGSVYPPILYMGIKGAENIAGYEFAQGLLKRYLDGMVEVFDYSDTVWEFYAPDQHSHTELLATRFHHRVQSYHRNSGRAPCTTHASNVHICEIIKTGHTLAPGTYVTPARRTDTPSHSALQQYGASLVAPDFVGWAGLGPIALLIENIIGIQAEVPNRRIEWHLTRTDRHGINSLWLGKMGKVDLIASPRSARNDAVTITVSTSDDEIADSSFELVVNRPECRKVTTLQVLLGQANQSFSVSGCAAGLVISDSAFTVTEGDATGQSYTVALETQPSAAVTVAISGQAGTDLVLDKASLSFSTTNWSSPQTVRVTATDDADGLIDPAVILTHAASGGDYGAVSKDLTVTIDEDDSYWLRDLALGQVTSVTGTVASGEGYMAVDGSADTAVALSGSWTLAVDLVDVYELATVQVAPLAGVQLGGFVVEGRAPGSGSGTWEELGRITAAGGDSVTVSSSQLRDMVRISPVTAPSAGTSDSVAVLEVFGYELRQGRSLTMDFSGSLADAGLTQRGSSFSIDSGRLVSGAGSSSFVVADLCGGCDLDHEAVRQATVTMLVEFPAVNPAGSNIGVSLGVGFEESQGRQRGVLAELGPWRPVSGEEGPLTMSLYCGGGGSGGPGRLRGWGVNLACSGSSVEKDFVDNTGQDLTDAFDPDVTLPGGRVWVELEYRNLKLWVRVWPEGEERPVLPRSGLRFGAEHFGGSSFNRDRNWLLNPGRLSLRAWGFKQLRPGEDREHRGIRRIARPQAGDRARDRGSR